MNAKLEEGALSDALSGLPEWRRAEDGRAIRRDFTFAGFAAAFAFMVQVALAAEKADHHPDWSNSYNKVSISLTTHSAGGVTGRDMALAAAIDRLAAGH